MQNRSTPLFLLAGLPRLRLDPPRDSGLGALLTVHDTMDEHGLDDVRFSIHSRHTELLTRMVEDWNAAIAVLEFANEGR